MLNFVICLFYLREGTVHHFGIGRDSNFSQPFMTLDGIMDGNLTTMRDLLATENCSWLGCRVYDKLEYNRVSYYASTLTLLRNLVNRI